MTVVAEHFVIVIDECRVDIPVVEAGSSGVGVMVILVHSEDQREGRQQCYQHEEVGETQPGHDSDREVSC